LHYIVYCVNYWSRLVIFASDFVLYYPFQTNQAVQKQTEKKQN